MDQTPLKLAVVDWLDEYLALAKDFDLHKAVTSMMLAKPEGPDQLFQTLVLTTAFITCMRVGFGGMTKDQLLMEVKDFLATTDFRSIQMETIELCRFNQRIPL